MKFSTFAAAATLASTALANTVYVTRVHYVTVEANGEPVGTEISIYTDSNGEVKTLSADESASVVVVTASSSTPQPTTLLTVQASYLQVASVAETSKTSSSKASSTSTASSTSSSSSSSGIYAEIASSGVDSDFATNILDAHNEKRALHSAPDLSWSTTLYDYAQAYADKYVCDSDLVHSGGEYGENLAVGYATGVSALEAWYSEGDGYDYSTATVLDHFTQVVWKSTTKLGCGYKLCSGGVYNGLYVICSYDPAGNFVGEGLENVLSS